ncbi:MAG: hypothetical protein GY710_14010 [Desulfobacteraceae bacterium]|nr:hypothetical protein [Desulfobacteraceae bacterium]
MREIDLAEIEKRSMQAFENRQKRQDKETQGQSEEMETIFFEKLDADTTFNYKKDLMDTVQALNYEFVSQLVYDKYYIHKEPASAIADSLPITKSEIYFWMRKWGFTRRARGGNTKNPSLHDKIKKIATLKGSMTVTEAAGFCGCSVSTVRKIWNR